MRAALPASAKNLDLPELRKVLKMKITNTSIIAMGFVGILMASPASAQSASPEEVKICQETIKEMTGGKPSAGAVKLCDQGKLNEAIEKAMSGG